MKIVRILTIILLSVLLGTAISTGLEVKPFAQFLIVAGVFVSAFLFRAPIGALMTAFTYTDALFNDEPDNMADYKKKVYWAPASHVTTAPTINANPTTAEEASHAVGSFTMVTDKFFIQLYATSVTFTPEGAGERDSKHHSNKGEIFLPGSSDQIKAYARKFNNAHGYLIIVEENGERELIGIDGFPCYLNPKYSGSEKRGLTLAFEAESSAPGLRFDGAIPLSSGQVDPIS